MQGESPLVTWIGEYQMGTPQLVRLQNCVYELLVTLGASPKKCSPLSSSLPTYLTSTITQSCHIQKFSYDMSFGGCVQDRIEEYVVLNNTFVK